MAKSKVSNEKHHQFLKFQKVKWLDLNGDRLFFILQSDRTFLEFFMESRCLQTKFDLNRFTYNHHCTQKTTYHMKIAKIFFITCKNVKTILN